MKIKSILQLFANIMGSFKQCGEISAISRHCLIVLLRIAFSKSIITSHWPVP